MSFGARFKVASRSQLRTMATPPSGNSPEAIWHQLYDTQTYVDSVTTSLTFFQNPALGDKTLSNMEAAGQLSDPKWLSIFNITCDFLTQNSTQAAALVGEYNDLSLLLKVGRPTWTLTISDKTYGPYSLTVLHATGGPVGGIDGGTVAAVAQWANNVFSPGWDYKGTIIIPPKNSFDLTVRWAAAQDLTGDVPIRISLFGIQSRRVV